jgi:PIN domain nuclease of toxin-antitoxin system
VSNDLLLDTHIALWLDSGNARLRKATRQAIDACWLQGGRILLSAVSAWEIAVLIDSGRITLDVPAAAWVARFTNRPAVEAVSLTASAACLAYQLEHLEHRDPADRLLIATSIELGCALVTYDERIARFAMRHGRRYGFDAVG